MFWKGHLFFVVFNNKSTIIKTFLCTSNNHFICKSLKERSKASTLPPFTFNSYSYTLLHTATLSLHLIMPYFAVTRCKSTSLPSDTSLYAILAIRRFVDFLWVISPLPVISARLERTRRRFEQENLWLYQIILILLHRFNGALKWSRLVKTKDIFILGRHLQLQERS